MRARSVIGIVVAIVIAVALIQWLRPIPLAALRSSPPLSAFPGRAPHLPWPAGVQAAVDVAQVGAMGRSGPAAPLSIGSVAKVMTALLVLKRHPLGLYSNGPSVTITAADVAAYQADVSTQQSVMPVTAGEKLSERTLLEGLLVPSANNVAVVLAKWMAGSQGAFVTTMNAEAKSLGMGHTHYADASGLDPTTVSTASDQVRLAEVAMRNPVFASIVAMPQMQVPGFGLMYNYNTLIGRDGIVGVKTGSIVPQGASFIWAGQRSVGTTAITIYGGVLGQLPATSTVSQLNLVLNAGKALLDASGTAVKTATLIRAGQTVGQLSAAWASVPLVAAKPVAAMGWGGLAVSSRLIAKVPKDASAGLAAHTRVGTLTVTVGHQVLSVPVETGATLAPPSAAWRIKRL